MTSVVSKEESNYVKISLLLWRISHRVVRLQFDKEFHPDYLYKTLKSEHEKLQELYRSNRISRNQWNLLFPKTGLSNILLIGRSWLLIFFNYLQSLVFFLFVFVLFIC